MKKILAVYDSDVNYVTRFLEYFKNLKDIDFEICAFTNKESMESYLKSHKIEILIYGKDLVIDDFPPASVKYLCQLREDRQLDSVLSDNDLPGVYKYQPARSLMEELLSGYARSVERTQDNPYERSKLITVYSLRPKNEAYAFAGSLALQYSKKKKTLFVPLDLLPTSCLSFIESSNQALSEFIYYLKENQNIIQKLKSLLCYNTNIAYLSGILHAYDLLSLCIEDINRLVSEIKLNTDFETIVFYLCFYNETAIELLQLSDTVILPLNQTEYETALLKEWEGQMERVDISTDEDKYLRILLQADLMDKNRYDTLMELSESPVWKEAAKYL